MTEATNVQPAPSQEPDADTVKALLEEFSGWMDAAIHTQLASITFRNGRIMKLESEAKEGFSEFIVNQIEPFMVNREPQSAAESNHDLVDDFIAGKELHKCEFDDCERTATYPGGLFAGTAKFCPDHMDYYEPPKPLSNAGSDKHLTSVSGNDPKIFNKEQGRYLTEPTSVVSNDGDGTDINVATSLDSGELEDEVARIIGTAIVRNDKNYTDEMMLIINREKAQSHQQGHDEGYKEGQRDLLQRCLEAVEEVKFPDDDSVGYALGEYRINELTKELQDEE